MAAAVAAARADATREAEEAAASALEAVNDEAAAELQAARNSAQEASLAVTSAQQAKEAAELRIHELKAANAAAEAEYKAALAQCGSNDEREDPVIWMKGGNGRTGGWGAARGPKMFFWGPWGSNSGKGTHAAPREIIHE